MTTISQALDAGSLYWPGIVDSAPPSAAQLAGRRLMAVVGCDLIGDDPVADVVGWYVAGRRRRHAAQSLHRQRDAVTANDGVPAAISVPCEPQ